MSDRSFVERVWYGADAFAATMRTVLVPGERLFGAVAGARDILYDAGWLPARETPIPVVSVGNLTVGGTGKTPMAAWIARGLLERGAHPAVVLRGYGADEPEVHKILNPDIPVAIGADRVQAVLQASEGGATIAVLDDGFQHRRIQRVADIVLVSADRWTGNVRLLPAGPWREPLNAIRRATLVVVTSKAASEAQVNAVNEQLAQVAPSVPRVSVRLSPNELVRADNSGERRPLEVVGGSTVHAVLSIADPNAFVEQLRAHGALVHTSIYPDHHQFTSEEVNRLAARFAANDLVLCTLKDAVKLAPLWPRLAPPLWYVSQRVVVERGVGGLEQVLDSLARVATGRPDSTEAG